MLWIICRFLILLLGLGGVAFITLLERKILGLRQVRLGPNKVSYFNLLQPVADGVKLLFKEIYVINKRQLFLFTFIPILTWGFFIRVWIWFIPWLRTFFSLKYASILIFALLGLRSYIIILTGWSSRRSFSKLGRIRGILQNLSFEVALILIFFLILVFFSNFLLKREMTLSLELTYFWRLIWLIFSLMETNRAPFDLLEGERELISGFNIEIGRLSFVFLFLREYGIIIVLRAIFSLSLKGEIGLEFFIFIVLIVFMRRCFPRVRYDVIITIMWQSILPLSLILFFPCWFLF